MILQITDEENRVLVYWIGVITNTEKKQKKKQERR